MCITIEDISEAISHLRKTPPPGHKHPFNIPSDVATALIRRILEGGRDRVKRRAFGGFIRNRRLELGLEQPDLAARMGISSSHVSNMETGRGYVSFDRMWPLAEALECEAWELVAHVEEALKRYDRAMEEYGKEEGDE